MNDFNSKVNLNHERPSAPYNSGKILPEIICVLRAMRSAICLTGGISCIESKVLDCFLKHLLFSTKDNKATYRSNITLANYAHTTLSKNETKTSVQTVRTLLQEVFLTTLQEEKQNQHCRLNFVFFLKFHHFSE